MNHNRCIRNLLKLICLLQKNSQSPCNLEDGCTKPFLGPTISSSCYNTRVISLYKKDGTLFTVSFTDNALNSSSSVFRVMDVEDNCCTLLILNHEGDKYISTKQYITIRINCICAIRCITDVDICL